MNPREATPTLDMFEGALELTLPPLERSTVLNILAMSQNSKGSSAERHFTPLFQLELALAYWESGTFKKVASSYSVSQGSVRRSVELIETRLQRLLSLPAEALLKESSPTSLRVNLSGRTFYMFRLYLERRAKRDRRKKRHLAV